MKLSPRLKCVADMVEKGSYVADIGTDHAYIPIYLIKEGFCKRAIGTDVRTGPLKRAEENVKIYGLKGSIELRQGYGLSPIAECGADCVIMAGMGGYLISDILDKDKLIAKKIDYFILQPIQAPEAVREFLYKNGYKIYDEALVRENQKIYQVIAAKHGTEEIDDNIYFEIGKKLIDKNEPMLTELIERKIEELDSVIHKVGTMNSINAQNRVEECRAKIQKYREVLKCL